MNHIKRLILPPLPKKLMKVLEEDPFSILHNFFRLTIIEVAQMEWIVSDFGDNNYFVYKNRNTGKTGWCRHYDTAEDESVTIWEKTYDTTR